MNDFRCGICTLVVLGAASLTTHHSLAEMLTFRFHDQAGDPGDGVDLTGITMRFDNVTGEYTVEVNTHPDNPLNGRHLLYLYVLNLDVDPMPNDMSLFSIGRFDVGSTGPSTSQIRTGVSPVLTHWSRGDLLATYNPDDSVPSFQSRLTGNLQSSNMSDGIRDTALVIPEPSTAWLLLTVAAVGIRRRSVERFTTRM